MNSFRIEVPHTSVQTRQSRFVESSQILLKHLHAFLCHLKVMHIVYLILRYIPEKFYPNLLYPIEYEVISTSTRVIFTRSKHNNQQICLKLWQLYDHKICNESLVTRNLQYLLEGFEFNRRVAPDVYLGVAPVEKSNDKTSILRGRLIEKPEKRKLKSNVEYALMMRSLEEEYRLDSHLKHNMLEIATKAGMEFLAGEIALIHFQLNNSPDDMGTSYKISSKLDINIELFHEALNHFVTSDQYIEKYRWITDVMVEACKNYTQYFEQRYKGNHIKRCHGDLKTTNLWIYPKKSCFWGLMKCPQQLIALDCVDFNPDFCHIDTLSDVAMLAIDLEMHLSDRLDQDFNSQCGQEFSKHFLITYLEAIEDNSEAAKPLLEYYMTEKAMVCAYVSILYDERPLIGKKYLEVASNHAQRLKKMLEQFDSPNHRSELLVSSTLA